MGVCTLITRARATGRARRRRSRARHRFLDRIVVVSLPHLEPVSTFVCNKLIPRPVGRWSEAKSRKGGSDLRDTACFLPIITVSIHVHTVFSPAVDISTKAAS